MHDQWCMTCVFLSWHTGSNQGDFLNIAHGVEQYIILKRELSGINVTKDREPFASFLQ